MKTSQWSVIGYLLLITGVNGLIFYIAGLDSLNWRLTGPFLAIEVVLVAIFTWSLLRLQTHVETFEEGRRELDDFFNQSEGRSRQLLDRLQTSSDNASLAACLDRGALERMSDGYLEVEGSEPLLAPGPFPGSRDDHLVDVMMRRGPSLFTSLGILFTFIGLVYGLQDLQFGQDAETLSASLKALLPQVGVAFLSSFIGIASSAISLVFGRPLLHAFRQSRETFSQHLEFLDIEKSTAHGLRRLEARMSNLAAEFDKMKQSNERLRDEFQETRDEQFERHRDVLERMFDTFTDHFRESLDDPFDALRDRLEAHRNLLEETQRQREDHQSQLGELLDHQRDLLDHERQLRETFRREVGTLADLQSRLETYTEHIETSVTVTRDILEQFESLRDSIARRDDTLMEHHQATIEHQHDVRELMAEQVDETRETLEAVDSTLQTTMEETTASLATTVQVAEDAFERGVDDLLHHQEDVVTTLSEQIESTENHLNTIVERTQTELIGIVEEWRSTVESTEHDFADNIEGTLEQLEQLADGMAEGIEAHHQTLEDKMYQIASALELLERLQSEDALARLEEATSEMTDELTQQGERFEETSLELLAELDEMQGVLRDMRREESEHVSDRRATSEEPTSALESGHRYEERGDEADQEGDGASVDVPSPSSLSASSPSTTEREDRESDTSTPRFGNASSDDDTT